MYEDARKAVAFGVDGMIEHLISRHIDTMGGQEAYISDLSFISTIVPTFPPLFRHTAEVVTANTKHC